METNEKTTGPESGPEATSSTMGSGASTGTGKKSFEEKLDDFAEKFSRAMADGVKRMEDAFEKGVDNFQSNPNASRGKIRGFFSSSTGATVLIIGGVVWLFYAIGLLDNAIFPILLIILGIYLLYRNKNAE